MNILILGGDGYLGWPTALEFASRGHDVFVVDNYSRRIIAEETNSNSLINTPLLDSRLRLYREMTGKTIYHRIFDCTDYELLSALIAEFVPDVLIHYAEQPSAPYSMRGFKEAKYTLENNIGSTFNVIWACINHAPKCHIVKLGTMGEYGTPDIDIEEGWLTVQHKGRHETFLYPRQAGSLYHTSKILDTDLIWFYVRTHGLTVTDLMQGPVYGMSTEQTDIHVDFMPNFHYDDIFGTVVNRFLVQAVAGVPLTVYGAGGQTRGYLNLIDTLQCVRLAVENPPEPGNLRILNQYTETFSVNELAEKVVRVSKQMGISCSIRSVKNPRRESENHYYNPKSTEFKKMGLHPTLMTDNILEAMLERILKFRNLIKTDRIMPRVTWNR